MSLQKNVSLVAKIILQGQTYYVTDRKGITLDSQLYTNAVVSWGSAVFMAGTNGQYGSMAISLVNGEEILGNGYLFDPTKNWNNGTCTVKRWISGATTFDTLTPYFSGLIKGFQIKNMLLDFNIDATDRRDTKLVPAVITNQHEGGSSTTDNFNLSTSYRIITQNTGRFFEGELVFIRSSTGEGEYSFIDDVVGSSIYFFDPMDGTFATSGYANTITKAFLNIPKNLMNKTIPIQMGILNSPANGKFGKLININNQVGQQVLIADYRHINDLNNIGVWEPGLERYFEAKRDTTMIIDANHREYDIYNNFVSFTVDTTTTLLAAITSTNRGIEEISVTSYQYIDWVDEYSGTTTGIPLNQDVLSINILAIDNELMLLVDKPTTSSIFVDRGYLGTTITAHASGTKIYQSAKFAIKNLLAFTERFMSDAVTNFHIELVPPAETGLEYTNHDDDPITNVQDCINFNTTTGQGTLSNLVDESTSNYAQIEMKSMINSPSTQDYYNSYFSFDARFKHVDKDFTVIGWYPACSLDITTGRSEGALSPAEQAIYSLRVYDPDVNIFPNISNQREDYDETDSLTWQYVELHSLTPPYNTTDTKTTTWYSTIDRDFKKFNYGTSDEANINANSLKYLNKKWKFVINHYAYQTTTGTHRMESTTKIKTVGWWIDFAGDFTKENIVGGLQGREITTAASSICGGGSVGTLATNIIHCLSILLTEEVDYSASDFGSSFSDAYTYSSVASNYDVESGTPQVVMSYGVDDKQEEGWSFVSRIANDFNFQIHKSSTGTVEIINMHQLFINTPTSSHEIKIEDINFVNGSQLISVKQTGTDLIYNNVIVKYARNNALDSFSQVYETPDTYSLLNAGHTLSTARTNYYGGKKRTKVIESFAIWEALDAERLAHVIIEEFAEVHFYIEIVINFDHYSDSNSLSNQYVQGDLINLEGSYGGIEFTDDEKFYITHIEYINNGQDIMLKAKSINPISAFTAS